MALRVLLFLGLFASVGTGCSKSGPPQVPPQNNQDSEGPTTVRIVAFSDATPEQKLDFVKRETERNLEEWYKGWLSDRKTQMNWEVNGIRFPNDNLCVVYRAMKLAQSEHHVQTAQLEEKFKRLLSDHSHKFVRLTDSLATAKVKDRAKLINEGIDVK
jgi:hypothetical protein